MTFNVVQPSFYSSWQPPICQYVHVQSIFIKQIISALAPDPQNNFGSTGSATLIKKIY